MKRHKPDMAKMTIGNQLKKERQKKQVTLNEVYQQTRIHPNVLTTLEEDRFEQILNPAYIRSFLKEYAAYLGLDAKKILAEYDKLHPQEKMETSGLPSIKKRLPLPEIDLTKIKKLIIITAASFLAILIAISFVKGAVRIINNISQKRAIQAKQLELKKTIQPREVAAAKKEAAEKKLQKAVPPKPISEERAARPSGEVSIPAGEKLKLTITATGDVWLQLKVDGKIVFQNVLKKGTCEDWQADNSFTIWTGKAEVMQLNLNGNDLGTPGKGVKRNILVTREGIKR